jgi:hypothetical protein
MLKKIPKGKRCIGKPRNVCLCDAEYDLQKTGVRGCRKIARDTDVWKLILKEARVLHGTYIQWRSQPHAPADLARGKSYCSN